MIRLSKKEIYSLQPAANKVLLKPNRNMDEYKLRGSDLTIYFDPSYNLLENAPVTGLCVACCIKTTMTASGVHPKVETLPGDLILFSYLEGSKNCDPKIEETIVDDATNELYFIVEYSECYAAKRGDQVIALNHYHICERVKAEPLSKLIESIDHDSTVVAKVLFAPAEDAVYRKDISPGKRALPGQYIVFDKYSDFELEYDIHRSLLGSKELIGIPQRDIIAVLDNLNSVRA